MKRIARSVIALAVLSASTLAIAQPADQEVCAQRQAGLTSEMENAKSAGEDAQALSLERARGELAVSCSEPGARAMHDRRVSTQEKKVTQMQKELDAARSGGKEDNVAKATAKLKEAQASLAEMKRSAPPKSEKDTKAAQKEQQRHPAHQQPAK